MDRQLNNWLLLLLELSKPPISPAGQSAESRAFARKRRKKKKSSVLRHSVSVAFLQDDVSAGNVSSKATGGIRGTEDSFHPSHRRLWIGVHLHLEVRRTA